MNGSDDVSPLGMVAITIGFWCLGGFFVLGAIRDWDWIFNSRKYRLWVKLLGRTTVRILFGALGVVLAGFVTLQCIKQLLAG